MSQKAKRKNKFDLWREILRHKIFQNKFYILIFTSKFHTNLKFHERVISALKFELSDKRSQILVVNSYE